MDALARLRALPLAAVQRTGLDPATLIGAVRLVADRRLRLPSPAALARFARDVLSRGRHGVADLIHLHALASPFRPALVFGARRMNWRELDRRGNRLAHALHDLGVGHRDRVALLLHNAPEHVEAAVALLHLGATAVQIGYRLKAKEIAYLLADSGARALIFHGAHAAVVEEALAEGGGPPHRACMAVGGAPGFVEYEEFLRRGDPAAPPRVDTGGEGGIMVYTSGTTGHPKGAPRDLKETGYGPVLNFMADLPLRHDERHLIVCPLYHSAAQFFSTITLAIGGTVVLQERFEPEEVLRAIEQERVSSMVLVPTMWSRLLALGAAAIRRFDISSLRWVMSAAAPLPTGLAGRIEDVFGPILYNFYGATETGLVTLARPGEHTARPGTIGRVVRGTEVRLLDDAGRDVEVGEVGEIWVRNRMMVSGYYGDVEATREARRDGFFTVGDLGYRDADGYYYLADRKKDMVISGGINIYPLEIEQRLQAHPDVADCAVVGYPDEEWGEALAAFIVRREGAAVSGEELAEWVTAEMADYKRPRRFQFVEALPRNPTGKVLKRELRERLAAPAPSA